jgi:uncharacterized protein (TIGR01777 family)
MRVLITGSSGLIGTALTARLRERGDRVVRLVRREPARDDERRWDPAAGFLEPDDVSGFDVVVNLAGVGIGDKRWTGTYKELIRSSRIDGTRLLAATLAGCSEPPAVLVSASAIGIYGDRGDEELDERSAPGDDFLAGVVTAWEAAAVSAEKAGIRVAFLRMGIVLDRDGGAVGRMMLPFRLGLGGKLGDGKAWWSWIALGDAIAAIEHVIDNEIAGAVNLVAPAPVRSAEFSKRLARALRRPAVLPIPKFALDMLLGRELSEALVFTSARVAPRVLLDSEFSFDHQSIETALAAMLA